MRALSFEEFSGRLRNLTLPPVDAVIGILNGGLVPASLLGHQLSLPLHFLSISFRDETNTPRFAEPRCKEAPEIHLTGKHLLLVDDVAVSGKTLEAARRILPRGNRITSLVMIGAADIVVFPEIEECVDWPWKQSLLER